jgi:hypothetical protein
MQKENPAVQPDKTGVLCTETPQETDKRLSAQEISEHATLLADLMANGYSLEQATKQFAEGFNLEDWKLITETAQRNESPVDGKSPSSDSAS